MGGDSCVPSCRLVTEGGLSAWTVLSCFGVGVGKGFRLFFLPTALGRWVHGDLLHPWGWPFPRRVSQYFGEK